MNSIDGLKTCRKGLHQYPADKRTCPECKKTHDQKWREKNREKERERSRLWRKQNPERKQAINRRWSEKNPGYSRSWCERNRERHRETSRNWQKQNPDKARAIGGRRRAKKKQVTPPWADHAAINAVYAEALRLEKETGIKYHVDHIYPLNSPYMCGLHVAENLQILPSSENFSKSNKTWPGQLDCQRLPIYMHGFDKAA